MLFFSSYIFYFLFDFGSFLGAFSIVLFFLVSSLPPNMNHRL